MQPGDVDKTWADSKPLMKNFDYQPAIQIKEGVNKYLKWYKTYYNSNE